MSYPVTHISFSSMKLYHTNPGGWKEKYVLHNYLYKQSPSAIVGTMAHAVVAEHVRGNDWQEAQEAQLIQFNKYPDENIKWGKTGSREAVIKDFHSAVKMFFEEMPTYEQVLLVEEELQYHITDTIDGKTVACALPFKGYPDLVYRENGKLIIEDFKFKNTHTKDEDGPHPIYWTQACFYYYLVRAKFNEEPAEIRFREVKWAKNKDGSSQHNVISMNYTSEDFQLQKSFFWYQLLWFVRAIEDMDQDTYCLYNTFDLMTGREAFDMMLKTQFGYAQNNDVASDLVKVDRAELKNPTFIEAKTPDSIEGKIKYKFSEFGIALEYKEKQEGNAFDRYLYVPSRGVKMADVKKYAEDVAQATEIGNIRIVAPVPGTKYVGVELPRTERIFLGMEELAKKENKIMPIGCDIDGNMYNYDITDSNTPHLLIAGRTWSGKSEFLKVLIETRPKNTDLVIIDPKRVELTKYKRESLLYGVESFDALEILKQLILEMEERYKQLEFKGINNIADMPGMRRIMCVIEEFGSLRLSEFGNEIEAQIEKLTNMGRAAGIHIILATQRPDVKVISGRIKNNIGTRACFAVASSIDSKVILEIPGAEKLGGKGDMLYLYPGNDPVRLQAFYLGN